MKASDLFVRSLESEGVQLIFGIPGEENLDLLNSLRNSSIRLIVTRHEQAAGFMAATYGRLTGRVGVCLSTLGPGATNMVTATAYAQLGAMPMLIISGQKPIKTSRQGRFQILDVNDMMAPITKSTVQIASAHRIPARVREAIRLAEEERPGATHLELPEDVASEDSEMPVVAPSYARRPIAEEKSIRRAVELTEAARCPLMLIGAGANRKRTGKMLSEFLANTAIPFASTQMGKGVVNEDSNLFVGCAALSEGDFVHNAIDAADLILNVGHDSVEKPPFIMRPGGRTVIHINFFSAKVDPVYFPQVEVIGDIANSIWQINEMIEKKKSWDFAYFAKVREVLDKQLGEGADQSSFPISPQRLVLDVRAVMPSDGIVALDNGMYKVWFARNYRAHFPNTLLLDNALGTMGAGLPSAIAAKLVNPDKAVMAICGDGGFMMNSQEMETAARLGLDLTVLVLRDGAYGMIKWKQENMGFEDYGLDFNNPDFVKYAESYGAHGHRVSNTNELQETMNLCLRSEGVHLIEIPINYSGNSCLPTRALPCKF